MLDARNALAFSYLGIILPEPEKVDTEVSTFQLSHHLSKEDQKKFATNGPKFFQ